MNNNPKKLLITVIVIVVIVGAILGYRSGQEGGALSENEGVATSTASTPIEAAYTMAEVRMHNTASSCWSAIDGSVYDLTSWAGKHPGGPEAILSICGTDGTQAFSGQHAGQPNPENALASFRIGDLEE